MVVKDISAFTTMTKDISSLVCVAQMSQESEVEKVSHLYYYGAFKGMEETVQLLRVLAEGSITAVLPWVFIQGRS